jgi:ketosteroid isomerase-like protein
MQAFRDAIEAGDFDAAVALMADDVEFRSPVVFKPYRGPDEVRVILLAAFRVFEDFRYVRVMASEDGADHALEFRARVGDREVEACDLLHVNEDGLIDDFAVIVRPLSGLNALADAMRAQLEAVPGSG